MAKIRMLVELEYDESLNHGDNEAWRRSFFCDVLGADPKDTDSCLILHSNFIGDEVGRIEVISTMPANEQGKRPGAACGERSA